MISCRVVSEGGEILEESESMDNKIAQIPGVEFYIVFDRYKIKQKQGCLSRRWGEFSNDKERPRVLHRDEDRGGGG